MHADSLTGRSQRRTAGHQHPEPRLLIDQFLLRRHPQHLRSERCCDDRLNSPSCGRPTARRDGFGQPTRLDEQSRQVAAGGQGLGVVRAEHPALVGEELLDAVVASAPRPRPARATRGCYGWPGCRGGRGRAPCSGRPGAARRGGGASAARPARQRPREVVAGGQGFGAVGAEQTGAVGEELVVRRGRLRPPDPTAEPPARLLRVVRVSGGRGRGNGCGRRGARRRRWSPRPPGPPAGHPARLLRVVRVARLSGPRDPGGRPGARPGRGARPPGPASPATPARLLRGGQGVGGRGRGPGRVGVQL